MDAGRREFLRKGLAAAAAGGVGALAGTAFGRETPDGTPDVKDGGGGETTPALTPDGRLVHAHVSHHDGPKPGAAGADLPDRVREGEPGRQWVMVIDLARCDGCRKCTDACGAMHEVPPPREWIKVFRMQEGEHTTPYWFPKPCFHCDNPPCTKVCPVGATFKRRDGVVLVDNERCIGCRFCMAACPYSSRFFNWGRPPASIRAEALPYSPERGHPRRIGTVEKCDFCPDMAAAGKLPGCVSGCPMGTIYFGDRNEDAVTNSKGETVRFSALLKERAGYRFLEDLGTEPRVYYLPPKNRIYPAPGEEGAGRHPDTGQGHGGD